jgi:glycosyltransferase involved in cell wall biosynthesis
MKIVHIYKDYFPVFGGIENLIRTLAEAQAARGHDVRVVVNSLKRELELVERNGVRITKLPRHLNVQSAPISFSFHNAVRRETVAADIAHLHAPYPIGELCNLLFGQSRKTVLSWHSDIVRQKTLLKFYGPVLRRVIAHAHRIIPASEAYAKSSPWINGYLYKCRIVPYGIDATRFTKVRTPEARTLRQQWLAPFGAQPPLVVVGVGRLRYYKGFDDLIKAVARTRNTIAVIVGVGPMEMELKALAQQLGIANRVIFAGEPDDAHLPLYHQAADVFAAPSNSRAESFGISIIEAMASGLPAITTEIGTATSWINQHNETGLVVPPLNPAALASAIHTMQDAALRERMGKAARARVLQEFTQERMIERVMGIYEEVLS